MPQPFRLETGGVIDRSKSINFTFNGKVFSGFAGDTVASALLANGVHFIGRSFKYHRPRGMLGSTFEEPNAIIDVIANGVRRPNLKATEVELEADLQASSVNVWPSLNFDMASIFNVLSPLIPAGFYYKTFFWPNWQFYEPAIRNTAGLGSLALHSEALRTDHKHEHCDTIVIGGGIQGMSAALHAAADGKSVLLADALADLGGYNYSNDTREQVQALRSAVTQSSFIKVLTRTTVQGWYDHNHLMLFEELSTPSGPLRQRLWYVRASSVVSATGKIEQPLIFPGNDLPGIILASAVSTYVHRYAVKPGRNILIATNNDDAFDLVDELLARSIAVAGIVDFRRDERPRPLCKTTILRGSIIKTHGTRRVNGVTVERLDGKREFIACDTIAMSGGHIPLDQLRDQLHNTSALDRADTQATITPLKITNQQKAFVDFQNDVTTDDLKLATSENLTSIEHVKRYTTLGMATDQGKTSSTNAVAVLSALQGKNTYEIGSIRSRPPFTPVPVGAYAGRQQGILFRPQKRSPLHEFHERHEAIFEEFSEWLRPAWYRSSGSDREKAMHRECDATRTRLAFFDNSPLGKMEIKGRDAAHFLDFIYANTMSTLSIGRCRYGLMLTEQGVIMDDGIVSRLAHNHFFLTTTSTGASRVAAWLDEWLQCELTNFDVVVVPVTSDFAVPTITGPNARSLLQLLAPNTLVANNAFPHMSVCQTSIANIPVRVIRASFTGELSYEIYVSAARASELCREIEQTGSTFQMQPVGIDAWMSLRTEKGYIHVGTDTDGTTTAPDIGWNHILNRRDDFVGRRSLTRPANLEPNRYQLVGIEAEDTDVRLEPGQHLTSGRAPTEGYITSSCMSATLNRQVALAMLKAGHSRLGETINLLPGNQRVRVVHRTAYDPEGAILNA